MLSLQNLRSIKAMSLKEYEKYISTLADINENSIARLTEYESKTGHAFSKHGKHKEGILAKEAITTNRPRSCFSHSEDINYYLAQTIIYNAQEIAKWLFCSKDMYLNITLAYGEDVGIVFRTNEEKLEKCVSQELTICLGRSYNADTQTGFCLRTMYPSLSNPNLYEVIDNLGLIENLNIKELMELDVVGKEYKVESVQERQKRYEEELNDFGWEK